MLKPKARDKIVY
ncbi:hypothetical protein IEO21_09954 [Rhodonia placenta]|uniref:Uncharacterized protein n=1 Tax=Rhodonia placenta TaxID=104341 RepID=A0A8H7NTE3_9APHY|nr:hypothetical protein IEO21_09954 [Postia placenta]